MRAAELGANEKIIEATYRAMIAAFIEVEMIDYNLLKREHFERNVLIYSDGTARFVNTY